MLKVIFGDTPEVIYNTSLYFKNTYSPEWITAELAKKIIKDVDKSEVKSGYCIESPVLGQIPPERLSGGTKALLLMINEPEILVNASNCGDNCAKWILKIAETQDLIINLNHIMEFDEPFEMEIVNCNKIVRNMEEMLSCAVNYI